MEVFTPQLDNIFSLTNLLSIEIVQNEMPAGRLRSPASPPAAAGLRGGSKKKGVRGKEAKARR